MTAQSSLPSRTNSAALPAINPFRRSPSFPFPNNAVVSTLLSCPAHTNIRDHNGDGRFRLGIRKKFFTERVVKALDQAAQGSGGVPIPGGVQKSCRRGLVGMLVMD